MVLEAAFTDDASPNDTDAYDPGLEASAYPKGTTQLRIDLSKASRGFPVIGPLLGFNQAAVANMTTDIVREAPRIIQRNLTQEEVDACVTSVSQYMKVHSWVFSLGLIAGWYRGFQTRAEMTFPMNRAFKSVKLNPDSFGPLRGPMARVTWNVIRSSMWMAWWGVPAYVFGGIIGHMSMAKTQLSDPRLKQFHTDLQNEEAKKRLYTAVERKKQGLPQKPDGFAMPAPVRGGQAADEMSPQAGEDAPNPDIMARIQKERARRHATDNTEATSDAYSEPQSSQTFARSSRSSGDSASPQSSTGGESAWDRIRNQANSGEQSSAPSRWQPGQTSSQANDYTFDTQEEDKQLARAEAQREFDARLEKERQGKDFSSSQPAGKVW